MRRLILFRHAKAARHAGGGDRDRPLEKRGRIAAARMGRWIHESGLAPELAVVSDARRTRETLDCAAAEMNPGFKTALEPRIYEADTSRLLSLVRETPDSVQTLLAVGHNPGFAEFAEALAARGDAEALHRLRQKFPTAAVAVIDFDLDHWREIVWGGGTLVDFVTPARLEGREEIE